MKVEILELNGDGRPYQDIINKFLKKMQKKGGIYNDIKFLQQNNGTMYAVVIYDHDEEEEIPI